MFLITTAYLEVNIQVCVLQKLDAWFKNSNLEGIEEFATKQDNQLSVRISMKNYTNDSSAIYSVGETRETRRK